MRRNLRFKEIKYFPKFTQQEEIQANGLSSLALNPKLMSFHRYDTSEAAPAAHEAQERLLRFSGISFWIPPGASGKASEGQGHLFVCQSLLKVLEITFHPLPSDQLGL